MAIWDKVTLKTFIDTYIRNNGNKSITGTQMNTILTDIVDSMVTNFSMGKNLSITGNTISVVDNPTFSEVIKYESDLSGTYDDRSLVDKAYLVSSIESFTGTTALLSIETFNRISADSSLTTKLSQEVSTRTGADSSLMTAINGKSSSLSGLTDVLLTSLSINDMLLYTGTKWENEPTVDISNNLVEGQYLIFTDNTISGSTSIFTAVSTEISNRTVVDSSLATSISTAVVNSNSLISSEQSTRASADSSLATKLSSEISTRTGADLSLSTKVSSMVLVDSSLATYISNSNVVLMGQDSTETATRISADSSLTTKLSQEVSTRTGADSSLNTALSSEVSTRTGADSSLATKVSSMVLVDSSLATAINNITGGTFSGETSINTAISNEISNRISADTSLYNSLSGSSIGAEESARISADNSLASSINNMGSGSTFTGVTSLESAISSEGSIRLGNDNSLASSISLEQYTESQLYIDTKSYNGFLDRTSSNISFGGTRTFTISPTGTSYFVYCEGVKYTLTGSTIQIANTSGIHFIWYIKSGTTLVLSEGTLPGFNVPIVCSIYYNTITGLGLLANERHNAGRNVFFQEWAHETMGMRWANGGTGIFTNTGLTITQCEVYDDDMEIIIPSGTTNGVLYKNGTTEWNWVSGSTKPYYLSGTTICYNNGNTLTAVPTGSGGNYVASWVYATNNVVDPIITIIGQRVDTSITNARTNNTPDTLSVGGLPLAEMKLLYRVIYRNIAGTATYIEAADYRNVVNVGNGTYVATDHLLLTNIGTLTHTELESSISTESSIRTAADSSLATAIGSGGGSSSAYSAITYNVVSSGGTLQTIGEYSLDFNTIDMYIVNLSGNTTTGISWTYSGGYTGKTMIMKITNTGANNLTGCIWNATTCKVIGTYSPAKTNFISVICVSNTDPKYWVVIGNAT